MRKPLSGKTILANGGIVAGTVLVLALCLEGVARLLYEPVSSGREDFSLIKSGYYQRDEQVGWLPRPNVFGEHPYNGTMVPFHTNSHGLRGGEHSISKPSGVRRLIALGDSFTWGYRVRDDDVYPVRLEARLSGVGVEVINLGVTAFMTDQEVQYFKREGLQYDPDIVVLSFCVNDFYEADGKFLQYLSRRAESGVSAKSPRTDGVVQRIKQSSVLYAWMRDRINTNRGLVRMLATAGLREPLTGLASLDVSLLPMLNQLPEQFAPLIALAQSHVLELRDLLRARGIRLILVLIPSPLSVDDVLFSQTIALSQFEASDFDREQPYRMMEEFARVNQIELLNPLKEFRAQHSPSAPLYLVRDMHFNSRGHDLFAQAIARYLGVSE